MVVIAFSNRMLELGTMAFILCGLGTYLLNPTFRAAQTGSEMLCDLRYLKIARKTREYRTMQRPLWTIQSSIQAQHSRPKKPIHLGTNNILIF